MGPIRSAAALGAVLVCLFTVPTWALEVVVEAPDVGADTLVARFQVVDVLVDSDLTALGEGLPSTLSLVVDLWRVRNGWWDSLVRSQSFSYRFRRDLVRNTFVVQNPGRSVASFDDRTALAAHLQRTHEIGLAPPGAFSQGGRFYLTVKAIIQPLNLDDLEAIDAWLSGEVTTGRGEVREQIPEANKRVGSVSSQDISVPLGAIPEFIRRAHEAVAAIGDFRINCFGHLGDGNLHFNVFPPAGQSRDAFDDQAPMIKRVLHDLAHELGGSFSAEHGVGRLKVGDLERYGDPAKLSAMRAIKAALDPKMIMNPGAVLRWSND